MGPTAETDSLSDPMPPFALLLAAFTTEYTDGGYILHVIDDKVPVATDTADVPSTPHLQPPA